MIATHIEELLDCKTIDNLKQKLYQYYKATREYETVFSYYQSEAKSIEDFQDNIIPKNSSQALQLLDKYGIYNSQSLQHYTDQNEIQVKFQKDFDEAVSRLEDCLNHQYNANTIGKQFSLEHRIKTILGKYYELDYDLTNAIISSQLTAKDILVYFDNKSTDNKLFTAFYSKEELEDAKITEAILRLIMNQKATNSSDALSYLNESQEFHSDQCRKYADKKGIEYNANELRQSELLPSLDTSINLNGHQVLRFLYKSIIFLYEHNALKSAKILIKICNLFLSRNMTWHNCNLGIARHQLSRISASK